MTSLFAVCAALSLLSRLSYSSKLDGVRKFAFGILIFSVVSAPLVTSLDSLREFDIESFFSEEEDTEGREELLRQAFAEGIREAVSDKFGIRNSEIRVLPDGFEAESWRAEKIRVILSGAAALSDYHAIEKYINSLEIGVCEVEIEIG